MTHKIEELPDQWREILGDFAISFATSLDL